MYLKWHVPLYDQGTDSMSLTAVHGGCRSKNLELPALKLGVLLIPHESAEDIEPTVTTGHAHVAECKILCRVSFIGHSAKSLYAEGRTRQTTTLGKEALSKESLCRESDSRQRFTLGKDAFL
jgi:hypothetical protein